MLPVDQIKVENNSAPSESLEYVDRLNKEAQESILQDVNKAFSVAIKANEIAQNILYQYGYATSLCILGQCHQRFSDYAPALEKSLEAMEIFRVLGDKKGESDCLNTLGGVYNFLGDHQSRLPCNLRTLQLRQEAGDRNGEIGSLNNIGDTYIKLGNFEKALEYFNRCLSLEYINDRHRAIVIHNIGETYFFMKEYDKAEPYIRKGIELSYQTNYKGITCAGHIFLSQIKIHEGKLQNAFESLEIAMKIAKELDAKDELFTIYKLFSMVYEQQGDILASYQYYKLYHDLKEEVYSESNIQKIKNIQFRYEVKGLRNETEAERKKNIQLQMAYEQIEKQKNEIASKNISITDSIRYAKRLQDALLPNETEVKKYFSESFILYKPKDIVSGDFYWFDRWGSRTLLAVVDCTGHGVPGAFMSIVAYNLLNRAVNEHGINKPSLILNEVNKQLSTMLSQTIDGFAVRDGMDIALIAIDVKNNLLEFAGAYNSLYLMRDKQLILVKGDRFSIGASARTVLPTFMNHELSTQKGDCLYIFSDGYADQFGGPGGKKFKHKQLQKILNSISHEPMEKQKEILEKIYDDWKGNYEQVDDVCIIGFRI